MILNRLSKSNTRTVIWAANELNTRFFESRFQQIQYPHLSRWHPILHLKTSNRGYSRLRSFS